MPPEPVTGFCILPRVGDDVEHRARGRAAPSPAVGAGELAERRGVEVEPLDAHPHLVGPQLAAGVEALGGLREDPSASSTRCRPVGVAGEQRSHSHLRIYRRSDRKSSGVWVDVPDDLLILWQT